MKKILSENITADCLGNAPCSSHKTRAMGKIGLNSQKYSASALVWLWFGFLKLNPCCKSSESMGLGCFHSLEVSTPPFPNLFSSILTNSGYKQQKIFKVRMKTSKSYSGEVGLGFVGAWRFVLTSNSKWTCKGWFITNHLWTKLCKTFHKQNTHRNIKSLQTLQFILMVISFLLIKGTLTSSVQYLKWGEQPNHHIVRNYKQQQTDK